MAQLLQLLLVVLLLRLTAVVEPSPAPSPSPTLPSAPALRISAMNQHTCAQLFGRVKCFGYGLNGELGDGFTQYRGDAPGEMGVNLPFVDLGDDFSCVSSSSLSIGFHAGQQCVINGTDSSGGGDQYAKCWGRNLYGQLGYGDTDDRGDGAGEMGAALPTVDLGSSPFMRQISVIASGFEHNCAILAEHTLLKCWGRNNKGQLGYGDTDDRGDEPGEMGDNLAGHLCGFFDSSSVIRNDSVGFIFKLLRCPWEGSGPIMS